MSVPPCAVFVTLIIVTLGTAPQAMADGNCVDTRIVDYGDGLTFALDPLGDQIFFLVRSALPGNGIVFSVTITLPDCTEVPGVGVVEDEDDDDDDPPQPGPNVMAAASAVRPLIPLP